MFRIVTEAKKSKEQWQINVVITLSKINISQFILSYIKEIITGK